MKKTILSIILLLGTYANACPTLNETYTCSDTDGFTSDLFLTQKKENNIHTYNFEDLIYVADNTKKTTELPGFDITTLARCEGNNLITTLVMNKTDDNSVTSIDQVISLDSGKLTITGTLLNKQDGKTLHSSEYKMTCIAE